MVRSTYEDRQGTLWVCTVAGLDAFDRRTEKVTERIRLNVHESPDNQGARGPRGRAVDHLHVRQRAGLLGSPYAAAHAVFVQGPRAAGHGSSAGRRESTKTPTATCGWRRGVAAWSRSIRAGGARSDTATRRSIRTASASDIADVGIRGPRGEYLGGHGDDRTEPVSEKTAAVQALPP